MDNGCVSRNVSGEGGGGRFILSHFLHFIFIISNSNNAEGFFAAVPYTLCLFDMLGKKWKRVLVRLGLFDADNTTVNGIGIIKQQ